MTIQINSAPAATETSRVTEAIIGIDLTLLGAARSADARAVGVELVVEHMSFPELASAAVAASRGGIDFISLSDGFVTRSDHTASTGALDAAKTAGRLLEHAALGFSAEVPAGEDFDRAVELMNRTGSGWGAVELPVAPGADLEAMADYARRAHAVGAAVALRMRASEAEQLDLGAIAGFADAVRLVCSDPHEARGVRFALRSAAAELGRELRVLCELAFIVSATPEAAEERKILLDMLGGGNFDGKACVVGTVADVVDEAERWISAGATDGIVFLPASVPTDLATLIRGILPLMRARHA